MKKILIIDDDPGVLQPLGMALRALGYVANEAVSVREGLLQAFRDPPNLILCDVNFRGDESGYSAVETLRANPATSEIPIILMSGDAQFAGMRQGMDLGADDYLPKPFSVAQLRRIVEGRFERHALLQRKARVEMDELRVSLSSMLPHELLTPLAGIKGAASLILEDGNLLGQADLMRLNRVILDSADRLHSLIRRFLLFTELELATVERGFRFRVGGDLNAVIPLLAADVAGRFHRPSDLQVRLECGPGSVSVEAVEIIVRELLDNAFKFSTAGTPVQLTVGNDAGGLQIRVADQGVGIRPEEQSQVGAFRQFNRRLREQQGTGLGLSIAKKVTELSGGQLTFGAGNPGTVVEVHLPTQGG
jgi:signal transduction histidine kinase